MVALDQMPRIVVPPGSEKSSGTPSAQSAAGPRDMAVHHQQAVEMSFIVRDRTGDEDVRRLAYDIAQTQANQRGMLLGWLDLWSLSKTSVDGHMTWVKRGDSGHSGQEIKDVSLTPGMATNANSTNSAGQRAWRPRFSTSNCSPTITWGGSRHRSRSCPAVHGAAGEAGGRAGSRLSSWRRSSWPTCSGHVVRLRGEAAAAEGPGRLPSRSFAALWSPATPGAATN